MTGLRPAFFMRNTRLSLAEKNAQSAAASMSNILSLRHSWEFTRVCSLQMTHRFVCHPEDFGCRYSKPNLLADSRIP